ncbi:MAG: NAD(P)H-binding protein [Bacteroidetes bacterium]|nr:NAD(P)H-binding protein [Bacteroidota bacterium]
MKIAVCSASGQLGSAIVNQLKAQIGAEQVIGIARTPAKAEKLGIEIRKGDYNSLEEFKVALKGVNKVLLVSGMDAPEKRIPQHRNVIEAAVYNGVGKIVYTSIIGAEKDTAFSPIVQSNRQTEEDVKNSGLSYAIGRNGIYIEPDLEYIETYKKEGGIRNCAGDGKCVYTSRDELAFAYSRLLLHDQLEGKSYNLCGPAISQAELAVLINEVYKTNLNFQSVSVESYRRERQAALGDFLGTVIAGIYEGIRNGANDVPSNYATVAGRAHKSILEIVRDFYQCQN